MKSMMLTPALLVLLTVSFHVRAEDEPEEPRPAKPALPWDVAAMKEAFAFGQSLTYDHERTGKPKDQIRYEFKDQGGDEMSMQRFPIDAKGEEKADKIKFKLWKDHVDDLTDFLEKAAVTQEELTLGDKKYTCTVLKQSEGEGLDKVTRSAWYAKELVGFWVKYLFEREKSVESYTLVKAQPIYHSPGWKLSEIAPQLKDGAVAKYKITDDKGTLNHMTLEFAECTESGYKETVTVFDKDGKPVGEPKKSEVLWARYGRNFIFACATCTMSETEFELAGTKFPGRKFTTLTKSASGETQTLEVVTSAKHPGIFISRKSALKSAQGETWRLYELVELKIGK